MSGKGLIPFLVALVVVGGVSYVVLFDGGADTPSNSGGAPPVEGPRNGGTVKVPDPVVPVLPDGGKTSGEVTNVTRTQADPSADFDPSGKLVVSGLVTDAGSGKPIPEAEVEILYPADGDVCASGTTGEDGRYSIEVTDGIPQSIDLRARADGYAVRPVAGRPVTKQERNLTVDMQLAPAFSIEGRVVDAATGTPIEAASIEIRCLLTMFEDDWDDAESDESGYYKITGIEDLPREGFDVVAYDSDHAPLVKKGLTVPNGATSLQLDFQLFESITIRGKVMSKVTGQPIADAQISGASNDPEYIDDGEDELSDEAGEFELPLQSIPLDGLFVLISADEHGAAKFSPPPAPDARGVIDLGTIALGPPVHVAGYVVNRVSGAAIVSGDASVYAADAPNRDEGEYSDSASIENGRFELDLEFAPADGAEVLVEANNCLPLRAPLNIQPNQTQVEVRFEVEPILMLRGQVKRPDGTPVASARVRLLAGGGGFEGETLLGRTNAAGAYKIELPDSNAARFAVVVEYGPKRFPQGKVSPPPPGVTEIQADFTIEVPAAPAPPPGMERPGLPNRPMQPGDRKREKRDHEDDDDAEGG